MTTSKRRRTARAAIAAVVFALLVPTLAVTSGDSPAPADAATKSAKRKKQKPQYWGAWVGWHLTGTEAPYDMDAVRKFQDLVGKGLSIVQMSLPFASCHSQPCEFLPFPAAEMQKIRNYGAIPMLSWASSSVPNFVNQPDFQLADVLSGRYDAHIRNFAQGAKNWGHPFFMRFNWEMNGDWFPWGESSNGNQRGQSVAVWRRVHDIFTQMGVTNATWVWCPLADRKNTRKKLRKLYPGKRYVDWTCLDGYNWGNADNPHPWASFRKIFKEDYESIVKFARTKPLMLGEIGTHTSPGDKPLWFRKMFRNLRRGFNKVRALVYFEFFDRSIKWPVETTPESLAAFRAGINRPVYRANNYGGIAGAAPIRPPR